MERDRAGGLVLSRKLNQSIVIDGGIEITVTQVKGQTIRLRIVAPKEVKVVRSELLKGAA